MPIRSPFPLLAFLALLTLLFPLPGSAEINPDDAGQQVALSLGVGGYIPPAIGIPEDEISRGAAELARELFSAPVPVPLSVKFERALPGVGRYRLVAAHTDPLVRSEFQSREFDASADGSASVEMPITLDFPPAGELSLSVSITDLEEKRVLGPFEISARVLDRSNINVLASGWGQEGVEPPAGESKLAVLFVEADEIPSNSLFLKNFAGIVIGGNTWNALSPDVRLGVLASSLYGTRIFIQAEPPPGFLPHRRVRFVPEGSLERGLGWIESEVESLSSRLDHSPSRLVGDASVHRLSRLSKTSWSIEIKPPIQPVTVGARSALADLEKVLGTGSAASNRYWLARAVFEHTGFGWQKLGGKRVVDDPAAELAGEFFESSVASTRKLEFIRTAAVLWALVLILGALLLFTGWKRAFSIPILVLAIFVYNSYEPENLSLRIDIKTEDQALGVARVESLLYELGHPGAGESSDGYDLISPGIDKAAGEPTDNEKMLGVRVTESIERGAPPRGFVDPFQTSIYSSTSDIEKISLIVHVRAPGVASAVVANESDYLLENGFVLWRDRIVEIGSVDSGSVVNVHLIEPGENASLRKLEAIPEQNDLLSWTLSLIYRTQSGKLSRKWGASEGRATGEREKISAFLSFFSPPGILFDRLGDGVPVLLSTVEIPGRGFLVLEHRGVVVVEHE